MVKVETEVALNIPEKERRFLNLPPYTRDGLIPSWSEVVTEFDLTELHPRDFRLIRAYYRGHRRIAEGSEKRGRRVLKALFENPDFLRLEEIEGTLLSNIASFIRSSTEKKQAK